MPRIAVLARTVADQIAAGEVVERPASAVKELVENALDAGARHVDVDVEDGGRGVIRVSDDGCGMDPEDAVLALSRHATSKIATAADIVGVESYGFRGEALPAIASVSHLEVLTALADGDATLVGCEGGEVRRVEAAARRRGTTITVRQLFYNMPARRKFLRSARSEWRAVADTLVSLALTRCDVAIRATSDGREALLVPPSPDLRSRVAAVWGADFAARFVDVDGVAGPVRVRGIVERPGDAGSGSRRALVIVNDRAVRDHGIARAVESAYRSTLPAGVRPSFVLALTVPVGAVDVNVHPAKAEVRFHDRWGVERVVEQVVQRALGTGDSAPWLGHAWGAGGAAAAGVGGTFDRPPLPGAAPAGAGLFASWSASGGEAVGTMGATTGAVEDEATDWPVPALVQLRATYLMYEHDDGVVLIDQHSAHERVLYERFMAWLEGGGAASQRLLFAETLHLAPADLEAYEANADVFTRLGFEVEAFGGHSLLVHAVPTPHPRFDAVRCLRESLAALSGDRVASVHSRHEHLAATIACKAAIKAGDSLSAPEMRALFVALSATRLAAHDVHGRATVVRLAWDELERRFGRR